MSDNWIRASEISNYVYCRRAWWLRRVGNYAPENRPQLAAGEAYHARHGQWTARAERAQRLAYGLLIMAGLALVGWLIGLL